MTAVTQANVRLTADSWTQISAADVQTLQVLSGVAGVIFAAAQPAASVTVGSMGHVLREGEFLSNNTGGTAWGRADASVNFAAIGVTEG